MNADFIRERITELRLKKGVSEHRMSLDLGHARSYIHGIVAGRTLPSMTEFLAICEYFEISPKYFFDDQLTESVLLSKLILYSSQLQEDDLKILVTLSERLSEKPKNT